MLALCIMASSAIAGAKAHCKSGEIIFFTCPILKSNKVVSLCGGRDEGTKNISWLQYRFGRIGQPELTYPISKEGSANKFHSNYLTSHESPFEQYDVWFHIGDFNYSISALHTGHEPVERFAYVFYEQVDRAPNKPPIKLQGSLSCDGSAEKLMRKLGELVPQLERESDTVH